MASSPITSSRTRSGRACGADAERREPRKLVVAGLAAGREEELEEADRWLAETHRRRDATIAGQPLVLDELRRSPVLDRRRGIAHMVAGVDAVRRGQLEL